MSETCSFQFDPEEFNEGNRYNTTVKKKWSCPHERHVDRNRCIFHTDPEERELLGITGADLRDRLLQKINTGDPMDKEFIGANFGELEISDQDLTTGKQRPIDLRHCKFNGKVNLSGTSIDGPILFDFANFTYLEAPHSEFMMNLSLNAARIQDDLNLSHATVLGDASFVRSILSSFSDFSDATFAGNTNFSRVQFKNKSIFQNVEFQEKTDFSRTNFGQEADFTGSSFGGSANFKRSEFSGDVKFQYSDFDEFTTFDNSRFGGNSNFRGAQFKTESSFQDTRFSGWASFRDVKFGGTSDFSKAWLRNKITLVGESDTNTVVKLNETRLDKAELHVSLYDPVFYDLEQANIKTLILKTEQEDQNPFNYVRFLRTQIKNFNFDDFIPELKDNKWILHRTIAHQEDPDPLELEDTYKKAADTAENNNNKKAAAKFRKIENKFKNERLKGEGQDMAMVLNRFKKLFTGYGNSPIRLIIIAAVILIGILGAAAFFMGLI